jgi:hypothetical protein
MNNQQRNPGASEAVVDWHACQCHGIPFARAPDYGKYIPTHRTQNIERRYGQSRYFLRPLSFLRSMSLVGRSMRSMRSMRGGFISRRAICGLIRPRLRLSVGHWSVSGDLTESVHFKNCISPSLHRFRAALSVFIQCDKSRD